MEEENTPTMEDVLSAFGVEQQQEEEQEQEQESSEQSGEESGGDPAPPEDQQQPSEEPQQAEQQDSQEQQDPQEQEQQQQQQQQTPDKTAQAFASMRVQNKKYEQLMQGMAEVLGVQGVDDPDKLAETLKEKVTEAQAKQQNVDPQLLSRLRQLEERDQQYAQEERRRNAYLGFQRVKEEFGLDDKGLSQFADQLANDGINPFERDMDLKTAYIERNYDTLLKEAEARGAKKEAERAAQATNHSTTPDSYKGGSEDNEPDKVDSISDLEQWYNKHGSSAK